MSDNQQRGSSNTRVASPLDDRKMKLLTKNAEGKDATLAVTFFRDKFNRVNPRLTCYPNLQSDRDGINAKFDQRGFEGFLAMLKMAIDFRPTEQTPEFRKKVATLRPNFKPGGGRPDGVVTDCDVMVGQDKAGCVWVSLIQYQRTPIKFIITHDEYLKFEHQTGEAFSAGDASKLAATGWHRVVSGVVEHVRITQYQPEPPREPYNGGGANGGGNRGGYNNAGNGGGGSGNYDRRGANGGGGGQSRDAVAEVDGEGDLPF